LERATLRDGENGTTHTKRKRAKSFPGFWEVDHRKHLIYNISLTNHDWEFIVPERSEVKHLKMQAIIDVPNDNQARKFGVWTGRITSPIYEVDFWAYE